MNALSRVCAGLVCSSLLAAPYARAQSTEERFHDLFITAGYSTAFGAALSAAFLGLGLKWGPPTQVVATGASLGFIAGSVMGSYLAFSPVLSTDPLRSENTQHDAWPTFALAPVLIPRAGQVSGGIAVAAQWPSF